MADVIRGSYSGTYDGEDIGETEVGFRHSYLYNGRNINFDSVGETPVDIIYAGLNMNVDFVAQQYDADAIDWLRWPFNFIKGMVKPAGLSLWERAKPLLLTSCLVNVNPRTLLFPKAILAPGFNLDIDYSHKERPLPMRLIILPVKYRSDGYEGSVELERPEGCTDIVYFEETNWP
jgi:hypothetical protein